MFPFKILFSQVSIICEILTKNINLYFFRYIYPLFGEIILILFKFKINYINSVFLKLFNLLVPKTHYFFIKKLYNVAFKRLDLSTHLNQPLTGWAEIRLTKDGSEEFNKILYERSGLTVYHVIY